jgi:hypothetical protein
MIYGMYCKKCFYNLNGCENHACPECGRFFSPDLPKTYSKTPYAYHRHARMPFRIAIIVTAALVITFWAMHGPSLLMSFQSSITPRVTSVVSQHQTLRSQLTLYANQHNGNYPTLAQIQSWDVLTKQTDIDGNTGSGSAYLYGPYLQKPPVNSYTKSDKVAAAGKATLLHGWEYDEKTGDIRFIVSDKALMNQWNLDPSDAVVP